MLIFLECWQNDKFSSSSSCLWLAGHYFSPSYHYGHLQIAFEETKAIYHVSWLWVKHLGRPLTHSIFITKFSRGVKFLTFSCKSCDCNIDQRSTDLGSLIGNIQSVAISGLFWTQILCEINFGHFATTKNAILTIFAAHNFEFLETFDILKCGIFLIVECWYGSLWTSEIN